VPSVARPSRAPGRVRRALSACTGLALVAMLPACAGVRGASEDHAAAPVQRVLLFPLNVVAALPTEVESGVVVVSEELSADLEARGLEVESVELGAARDAWLQSALALKAEAGPAGMSFDGAASMLARRLAATRPFDVLVLPWIVVGPATMRTAGVVAWDGIRRKIQLAAVEGERRPSWAFKRFREQYSGAPFPASSLMVAVFSSAGDKLCAGAGGLELLVDVLLEMEARAVYFDLVPRPETFGDRDHLREGIAHAFGSCLGAAPRGER